MRLFLHIGAGKTGTSSIQNCLFEKREFLKEQGYWYLGLMLELAGMRDYSWQRAECIEEFHALDSLVAAEELKCVFNKILAEAGRLGLHTIIWSNESFFERNTLLHPTLKWLKSLGVEVKIVAYVRRHDAWARSAYLQWGIIHKSNSGTLKDFRTWFGNRRIFGVQLKSLSDIFPGCLVVRNFDATTNVVLDFMQLIGLEGIAVDDIRINESPDSVELYLRALYNGASMEESFPHEFDEDILFDGAKNSPEGYLKRLLPTDEDLNYVREVCANDRELLDNILALNGQPPIVNTELAKKAVVIDDKILLNWLAMLVMQQIRQLNEINRKIGDNTDKYKNIHSFDIDYSIDACEAGRLIGWARCKTFPLAKLLVVVKVGEEVIGSACADRYRHDLHSIGYGDCAFDINLNVPGVKMEKGVTLDFYLEKFQVKANLSDFKK